MPILHDLVGPVFGFLTAILTIILGRGFLGKDTRKKDDASVEVARIDSEDKFRADLIKRVDDMQVINDEYRQKNDEDRAKTQIIIEKMWDRERLCQEQLNEQRRASIENALRIGNLEHLLKEAVEKYDMMKDLYSETGDTPKLES